MFQRENRVETAVNATTAHPFPNHFSFHPASFWEKEGGATSLSVALAAPHILRDFLVEAGDDGGSLPTAGLFSV